MARSVHQQQLPVGFQPDENLLTPTFLPSYSLPSYASAHSLSRSNHSSFTFDIQVESPSSHNLLRLERATNRHLAKTGHYLNPSGSQPVSLPGVQPQSQPHESPVLPVLPRILSQPTEWGTPAVRPLDLANVVYEESPTPPGFQYPTPLGAAISGGVGRKAREKTLPQSPAGGGPSSSSYYASSPYVSKPDSSSVSTSQQPAVPPVTPKTFSLSSSSSQQPVVPPVTPNVRIYQGSQLTGNRGNGYHRNEGDDDEEDTSFDSATKRYTQWNSRMYRR